MRHISLALMEGPRAQGVGMVLPIEASMAHRPHFDLTLSATMTAITSLYVGFGVVRVSSYDCIVCHSLRSQRSCRSEELCSMAGFLRGSFAFDKPLIRKPPQRRA